MFPTVWTATDAIHVPMILASIKSKPPDIKVEVVANNESPAPVTSIGLAESAGKYSFSEYLLIAVSRWCQRSYVRGGCPAHPKPLSDKDLGQTDGG